MHEQRLVRATIIHQAVVAVAGEAGEAGEEEAVLAA